LFTSSDIGGHQATYIEDFLTDAYQTWDVPPVAFTLLGDYVDPGDPNHGVTALFWNGYSVSDNLLADIEGDDYLPDIIPGRIMAKNNDQLAATVGKMIDYESNPPLSSVFYNRPLVTGGWATDRWYTLLSETIYGFQENELGKSPERIYTLYDGSPGSLWSTADNTQMLVDYFGPAGLGYIPLDPSYLSDWTGSAALINDRINAGSYFVLHRDHGTEMTWVSPQYQIFDINALTNTEYPFVFSINCSSGKFNWPDCFTEFFCSRDGYGALGGLASAEISFSFCNDTYLFGVFDGLWPEFDPAYPGGLPDLDPPGGTELRTAFANAAGKYYLAASDWPNNPLRKLYTINLFHHFGDAFMQLYSEVPLDLTVDHASSCYIDDTSFSVSANPGALIALTYEGEIIGLSDGTGAPVDIPLSQPIDLGELRITITLPNYIRYDETVPIMPVPLLIQADGSGDAPTIQAAIELATSGGTIELGDGEYSGSGNRDISLMEKDLIIRSAGGDPALCIINCEGSDGDPHRGFSFSAADGPNVVISDLTIRGGWADQGGAIYCDSASAPVIIGCVIDSSFALRGGGLFCRKAGPLLSENTFAANSASDAGGGAYLNNTAPDTLLRGCTFVMNSAPTGSGLHGVDCTDLIQYSIFAFNEVGNAISCDNSSFELECCDMFGNQSGDWVGCVADIYPRFDNLNTDPCFCSLETGDYRLCDDSACLGSECGQIGAWPAGCAGSQDAVVLPPTEEPADFAFSIRANLPNPFTSMTRIAYTVPGNLGERKPVRVTIHDISGRLVRTLLSDNQSSGEHNITWDGNDLHGQPATTGIYACRIQIERGYLNRRLTLFR